MIYCKTCGKSPLGWGIREIRDRKGEVEILCRECYEVESRLEEYLKSDAARTKLIIMLHTYSAKAQREAEAETKRYFRQKKAKEKAERNV